MANKPKNNLTLEPLKDEAGNQVNGSAGRPVYRLFGYIDGEKIRMRSTDLGKLELVKLTKEKDAAAKAKQVAEALDVRQTWLSKDQLHDAESAYRRLPAGRTLFECVDAALAILGTGEPVGCEDSLTAWDDKMKLRGLAEITRSNNLQIARSFLRFSKIEFLHEATPKKIEDFVRKPGSAPHTQLNLAGRLHTWFEFAVSEKYLKQNPVQLDMAEMRKRARPVSEPDILTPAQTQALLTAATEANNAPLVFLIITGIWCFMRKAEVLRMKKENLVIREVKGLPTTIKIHVRGEKLGSKWRDIPVPQNVVPLLLESIKRGAFDPETGCVPFSEWDWVNIRSRAGLLKADYSAAQPRNLIVTESQWVPNIMRHTGMSYLFQETGGDIELVTRRAGNSAEVAFMHYLRHAEPDAYKAFNAVTAKFPVAHAQVQDVA